MSISSVARGGLFLFTGSIIGSILGYIFWFLVSVYGGVEVVGIASSLVALSSLVSGMAMLGLPIGARRFMGREYGRKNNKNLNAYFWSSFASTLVLCLLSALVIWAIAFLHVPLIGLSDTMLFFVGFMTLLSFSTVLDSLFTSTTKTAPWAFSYVASSAIKLALGVFLVYLGFGWLGALTGMVVAVLSGLVLMLFFALRELRRLGGVDLQFSGNAARESLHAGLASWLPGVITLLGQQLGIILIFGLQGGFETGTYFIAYVIFSIVYMLPYSLNAILFPALSGLGEVDRKNLARKALKICTALACPFAVFLVLYPELPLSIMGGQYIQAAPMLSILAWSLIPSTFIYTVTAYVYASGHYGKTLTMDLVSNAPRVMLYFVLIPAYKGIGAALSYLMGSMFGLVAAIIASRKVGLRVPSRKIAIAVVAPLAVALPCFTIGLGWLLTGVAILLTSIFSYGRLGVIERRDLAELAQAFASEKKVAKAGEKLGWLLRIIYGGQ